MATVKELLAARERVGSADSLGKLQDSLAESMSAKILNLRALDFRHQRGSSAVVCISE